MLEAKIFFGEKLVASIGSEFIENNGEFLIRYKKGSIPSIAEEYEKIPEKGKTEKAEFVNDIDYDGKPVHVLRYRKKRLEKQQNSNG